MTDRKDAASGILPICNSTKAICLLWRSPEVKAGNRFGCVGGMMKEGQTPEEGALMELAEEVGYTGSIELVPAFVHRSKGFTYHSFLGIVPEPFVYDPHPDFAWETTHIEWMRYSVARDLASTRPQLFHHGVIELFEQSDDLIMSVCGS